MRLRINDPVSGLLSDRESEARSLFTGAIFKRTAEVFDLGRDSYAGRHQDANAVGGCRAVRHGDRRA
jgi:hypothetical protein